MANREVIELLEKYIFLLNSEGLSVNKAFLFGSYSTNTASENSDIDVLIVSDKYDENDDEAAGKAWNLTRKINPKIEPLLIGLKKFKDENASPLINMIKLKGIEIAWI
jgi:predicted nucleotidyltransferase